MLTPFQSPALLCLPLLPDPSVWVVSIPFTQHLQSAHPMTGSVLSTEPLSSHWWSTNMSPKLPSWNLYVETKWTPQTYLLQIWAHHPSLHIDSSSCFSKWCWFNCPSLKAGDILDSHFSAPKKRSVLFFYFLGMSQFHPHLPIAVTTTLTSILCIRYHFPFRINTASQLWKTNLWLPRHMMRER